MPDLRPVTSVVTDNLSSHKGPAVRAMRKAAERTVAGLRDAIGRLIDAFTPGARKNVFAAAGCDAW